MFSDQNIQPFSDNTNLENLQVHLLDELGHHFSVIGVSETKITKTSLLDLNPSIAGYEFEYVPTPLATGAVGMYLKSDLNYTWIEKSSEDAFQALWIEIHLSNRPNIICGIMYRQHNTTERFQEYFDETLEKFSTSNKSFFVVGDFNINLLGVETRDYPHNLLLSLQSFSLIPTIDKPTCVYKNTAKLIDNILVNKLDAGIYSGNIISDISDHHSQFCIFQKTKVAGKKGGGKMEGERCGIFLISQKIVLLTRFPSLIGILFPAPRLTQVTPFLFFITKLANF